jgi:hypothetical protein
LYKIGPNSGDLCGFDTILRELQNVIERAVILSDGDIFCIDETWLSARTPRFTKPTLSGALLGHVKEMIEAALAESQGRVSGPRVRPLNSDFRHRHSIRKSSG